MMMNTFNIALKEGNLRTLEVVSSLLFIIFFTTMVNGDLFIYETKL